MALVFKSASYSHVGMVRQVNEDACLDLPAAGLWVVADGMGGHAAGDYVSNLIIDRLRGLESALSLPVFTSLVCAELDRVNTQVCEQSQRVDGQRMGSTVVVLAMREAQGFCLWAGDSRLYRLREGALQSLSKDHSYVQGLVDSGLLSEADARLHPRSNIVTRAVGVAEDLELDSASFDVREGDTYLLCSDGLNKTADDDEIRGVLAHADSYTVVRSLVHLGLTRGAPDNITAVVVKVSR